MLRQDGTTALSLAAYKGNLDVVRLLVDKAADINAPDKVNAPYGLMSLLLRPNQPWPWIDSQSVGSVQMSTVPPLVRTPTPSPTAPLLSITKHRVWAHTQFLMVFKTTHRVHIHVYVPHNVRVICGTYYIYYYVLVSMCAFMCLWIWLICDKHLCSPRLPGRIDHLDAP